MDRPEEKSEIDRKIGNYLRQASPEAPPAPADEYRRILEQTERRPGFFGLSWTWRLALPIATCLLALYLYLPRPAVSPNLSASAETYGGYGAFLSTGSEDNEVPGEDWILLAEIVSRD